MAASKQQMTRALGRYLVAAELTKRDYIVSLVVGDAAVGVDMLVTDQQYRKSWLVQIRINGEWAKFWLLNETAEKIESMADAYVFVNGLSSPMFHVMTSERVVATMRSNDPWYSFYLEDALRIDGTDYQDNWKMFGDPF